LDEHLLTILKLEVIYHCQLGMAGGRLLDRSYSEALDPGAIRYQDNMWFALQGILSIGANLAKLFWGSKGAAVEAERAPLRRLAAVDDRSPLKSRDVRNAFEHFDERVIDWFEAGDTDIYASRKIGVGTDWPPPGSRFGHYDPQTRVVTFLDHAVPIRALLWEFERIHGNLRPK
jgi:hypothetical protein